VELHFYLPAVLANLIAKDTGWSLTLVIAGLSWGFIVTGICSPKVGRFIEQFGGRKALSIGSIFFAVGLICLGLSTHLLIYYFAWTMLGIGMAFGYMMPHFQHWVDYLVKMQKRRLLE
jgi:MFS family permease